MNHENKPKWEGNRTAKNGAKEKPTGGPLYYFFSQYKGFKYNPHEPASAEFDRLRKTHCWKNEADRDDAQEKYLAAVAAQSNTSDKKDVNSLAAGHGIPTSTGPTRLPNSAPKSKDSTFFGVCLPTMEPLEAFFRRYLWFKYKRDESAEKQFNRLRREAKWKGDDPENRKARKDYRTALVRQFNTSFSSDDNNLDAWHALLRHIEITKPPGTVKECKKLIWGKFINLVDLVNARNNPDTRIKHFPTEVKLSKYTLHFKKIFPRDHEEAGTLLKYLFRHIEHPDPKRRDPSQTPRRQKKKREGVNGSSVKGTT